MYFLLFFIACQEKTTLKNETTDTGSMDTAIPSDSDTSEEQILDSGDSGDSGDNSIFLPESGIWKINNISVQNDPCGVANWEEPTTMVPNELVIANPTENAFIFAGQNGDNDLQCSLDEQSFSCEKDLFEQEKMGAIIKISNVTSGSFVSEQQMDMSFLVTLEECTDSLVVCGGMQVFLPLPCEVTLRASGSY